jgi:Trypsin-co-occurring domain 1
MIGNPMNNPDSSPAILVQVRQVGSGALPQSATGDLIEATQETLKAAARLMGTSLQSLVSEIMNATIPPSEVSLEFGVDVGAEGGVPFITKGSVGANFKIAVTWSKAEG